MSKVVNRAKMTTATTGTGRWENSKSVMTTVPASATAAGTAGQVAADASYLYVCVATNTWRRTALSAW